MNNQLKNKLDEFINQFLSQNEVRDYLLLKEAINNSQEIKELSEKLNISKKQLALSIGKNDYEEKKKQYEILNDKFNNHPLLVNFSILKDEVSYLIDELVEKIKCLK